MFAVSKHVAGLDGEPKNKSKKEEDDVRKGYSGFFLFFLKPDILLA